jgi:glycine/D-amino acid oxidase-like deaminating enzyme
MAMAGVRMPIESYPLQALVSEPVKPVFPGVVMSNTIQAYISQSDKGELVIRAGTDAYTSYFPMFRRMRMMRNWGGIVDVTPDRSPILGKTPRASTLTADGVRAASKQRQVRRMSLPRRSHATNRTRLPRPSHSSASPLAV